MHQVHNCGFSTSFVELGVHYNQNLSQAVLAHQTNSYWASLRRFDAVSSNTTYLWALKVDYDYAFYHR